MLTLACHAWAQSESEISPARLVEQAARYEHAEGVPRDLERAHALYCRAARAGSAEAAVRLGWMYANARGVGRDDTIAATLFRRAAAAGHEHGARLSDVVRAEGSALPDCLDAPQRNATADPGLPTPLLDERLAGLRAERAAALARVPAPYAQLIARLADEYRLDPRLVIAVIRRESNFDPLAVSPRNAQGLMQLIPETAKRFGVRNVFDPAQNLRGGMAYLRWLLAYFRGDVELALAAYNAGERVVERYGGVPPFAETRAYVRAIRAMYPEGMHAFDPRWISAPTVPQSSGSQRR